MTVRRGDVYSGVTVFVSRATVGGLGGGGGGRGGEGVEGRRRGGALVRGRAALRLSDMLQAPAKCALRAADVLSLPPADNVPRPESCLGKRVKSVRITAASPCCESGSNARRVCGRSRDRPSPSLTRDKVPVPVGVP
jgi:hypothetical protein